MNHGQCQSNEMILLKYVIFIKKYREYIDIRPTSHHQCHNFHFLWIITAIGNIITNLELIFPQIQHDTMNLITKASSTHEPFILSIDNVDVYQNLTIFFIRTMILPYYMVIVPNSSRFFNLCQKNIFQCEPNPTQSLDLQTVYGSYYPTFPIVPDICLNLVHFLKWNSSIFVPCWP